MNVIAHILKVPKTRIPSGYRHSFIGVVPVEMATQLHLTDKEGLLFKTPYGKIFPAVINIKSRKLRKSSYLYYFTLPKYLVNDGTKEIKLKLLDRQPIETFPKKLLIKNGNLLDLKKILPNKTRKNHAIYKFKLKNNILIWIYNRSHVKYFIFPRFIQIKRNDTSLLELMGFYLVKGQNIEKSVVTVLIIYHFQMQNLEKLNGH